MQHNPSRSPRFSRRAVLRATAAVGVGMPAVVATDALVVTPSWLSRSTFGFSIDGGPTSATATESLGPAARLLQLSALADELESHLTTELDFVEEAHGSEVFAGLVAEFEHLRAPFNLERVQPSVWRETPPTMSADRHGHECEKPPGLTRRLIEVLTLPGETVFEPFGGSSPVARVCEGMTPADARRWVSCETDAKHYARTVQMLSRSQMGLL